MSSIILKTKTASALTLLGPLLFLIACSGDGRGLLEEVEVSNLRLKSLEIGPPAGLLADLIVNPGTQHTLTLTAKNQADLPITVDSTNRRWSVRNAIDTQNPTVVRPTVARIDENGNFFALAEGDAVVTVRIGGIGSNQFVITVEDAVFDSIEQIIGADSMERCLPQSYTAKGRYLPRDGSGEGSLRGLPNASWAVVDSNLGSVSGPIDGVATATGVNVGSLELVASFEGKVSAPKSIAIEDTLREINIGPETAALVIGDTLNLIATGKYIKGDIERNNIVITESVQWLAEENNSVLRVSNEAKTKGVVSSLTVGNAFVTAACGNVLQQRTVVVSAAGSTVTTGLSFQDSLDDGEDIFVMSLARGPSQVNLSTGTGYDADADITTNDGTDWSVLNGADIVSVNNAAIKGLITPLSVGTATVRATYNNQLLDIEVRVLP